MLRKEGSSFLIDGYPRAIAVKEVSDPIAKEMQTIALHRSDLNRCKDFLDELKALDLQKFPVGARAIWVATLVTFYKCFQQSHARDFSLDKNQIFGSLQGALDVFIYFQGLRNKHVVHDENSYTQVQTVLVLNPKDDQKHVADILSIVFNADTANAEHIRSFSPLISTALSWVENQHNSLIAQLVTSYEGKVYSELEALPEPTLTVPTSNEVGRKR